MIATERLTHRYGELDVLQGIDLAIEKNELVVVIGPSGCGKSTFLSLLAGHSEPTGGLVRRGGSGRTIHQAGGLFPWLTVRENIALGGGRVEELVALMGLEGFEDYYPHRLSGGMKQRVELARALAGDASILFLDEPFASLDYQTRVRMRSVLLRALEVRPRTVVLVTHDIDDAVQLADRVVVLSARPAEVRTVLPLEIDRPRDPADPRIIGAIKKLRNLLRLE